MPFYLILFDANYQNKFLDVEQMIYNFFLGGEGLFFAQITYARKKIFTYKFLLIDNLLLLRQFHDNNSDIRYLLDKIVIIHT